MPIVDYMVPQSVDEAIQMLTSHEQIKVLAGGTDLIIQTKAQSSAPLIVVDLKNIPTLMNATIDAKGLKLGPAMSCAKFTAREDIKVVFPGLVEAAFLIGSTQVQGRASVGGNLCNASPAADTIPALMAVQATCAIQGPTGKREVPVEAFVTGVATNCLEPGEILTSINVPTPDANTADAYLRFIPRSEMDIAVAGAGVSITLDDQGVCQAARVAIGAVATTAILVPAASAALIGTNLDDAALEAAASAASAAATPITDRRATAEYRTHVVGILVKRAAKIAAERAKGK